MQVASHQNQGTNLLPGLLNQGREASPQQHREAIVCAHELGRTLVPIARDAPQGPDSRRIDGRPLPMTTC
eukprot:5712105-Alexandrium_andersonii.AAC.1